MKELHWKKECFGERRLPAKAGKEGKRVKKDILQQLKGGLVVSCQALETEPLHSSYIMGRMAYAAMEGGAVGIRANTPEDIREIRKTVSLPIIGLLKRVYEGTDVYITPTMQEVDALMEAEPDIIAIDATDRMRAGGVTIAELFPKIREKYPDMLFMADCSTFEDALRAQELGFDVAGTTLCGYTAETAGTEIPCYELLRRMCCELRIPVIAEGGIWERAQLQEAFGCGIHAAVVGTAITRPREITRRFVEAIQV